MLKNMKIKASLIFTFGIAILLATVIIIATLFIMVAQKNSYQSIINREIRADDLIVESRMSANIVARDMGDMAMNPGDTSKMATVNATLEELSQALQELKEVYPLADTTKLDAYLNAVGSWGNGVPDILTALSNGDTARAVSLIQTTSSPLLDQVAKLAQDVNAELDATKDDAIEQQATIIMYTILIVVVTMVVAVIIVLILITNTIKSITKPTEEIRAALVGFSQGNLHMPVTFSSKNELGEMCDAMRKSQQTLGGVIEDTCYLLEEMARGNFDVRSKDRSMYIGSLASVLKSVQMINRSLSDTLAQITQSAEQVSAGAEQVSTSAQALAQGATQQASAVEELSATINEISNNAQENARNSERAMSHSQSAGKQVEDSANYMNQMVEAMKKISESSEEISKIIATIENIAFQTNILALNAAVEAARAGVAGKGFAVVADEVRNLASKSDQASKATKDLIERSITSVKEGEEIVNRVSEALSSTIEATEASVAGIQSVNTAVEGEAESIAQIMEGIDQISSVVQTNSATSEESAAASEELSSQATWMKELTSRFKLRVEDGAVSPAAAAPSAYAAPVEKASYEAVDSNAASAFSKY